MKLALEVAAIEEGVDVAEVEVLGVQVEGIIGRVEVLVEVVVEAMAVEVMVETARLLWEARTTLVLVPEEGMQVEGMVSLLVARDGGKCTASLFPLPPML